MSVPSETVDPNEDHVAAIITALYGTPPSAVGRFETGAQHFVFEATLGENDAVVVRLSRIRDIGIARGAVFWSRRLRPLGIPLPEMLHVGLDMRFQPFPFIVQERLPGTDLGDVYNDMTRRELRALARQLWEIQRLVGRLPEGTGFGFAPSEEGPFRCRTWADVISSDLARSRNRIRSAGVVDENCVASAEASARELADYLTRVRPTPFLHDITTKNVLVDRGRLSGIVDVDDVCYGDPLFLLGLIRVALHAHDRDEGYLQDWLEMLQPSAEQMAALKLYSLVHCIGFMGELGNRFNRVEPVPVNTAFLARLTELYKLLTTPQ